MNNSFTRLIDGMCATLRVEVLTRVDDEFARGQVYGVINLLNTFKVRADWSAGFLLEQIAAQRVALDGVSVAIKGRPAAATLPLSPPAAVLGHTPIAELLAQRDEGNRAIGTCLAWLDAEREHLGPALGDQIDGLLRAAMRTEVDVELRNSPRPLFAEISSGKEG